MRNRRFALPLINLLCPIAWNGSNPIGGGGAYSGSGDRLRPASTGLYKLDQLHQQISDTYLRITSLTRIRRMPNLISSGCFSNCAPSNKRLKLAARVH